MRLSFCLASLFALAACGGDSAVSPPPPTLPPPVASVAVEPSTATLVPLQVTQLAATARDGAGNVLSNRTVTWATSTPPVATVGATGVVTATAPGQATITATSEGKGGTATITVQDGGFVGPSGASVVAANGTVTLEVPPGALLTGTALTVSLAANPAPHPNLIPGTAYLLGPEGIAFAQPITVRIRYQTNQIPQGVAPERFAVHRWNGTTWAELADRQVDTGTRWISGRTSGFSLFAVIALPENPVPTLTQINPSSQVAGGAGFTLTASGTSFVPGAEVRWNGSGRPTTFISTSQLTAQISALALTDQGNVEVTVTNPNPGGGVSAPQTFAILPATPGLNIVAGNNQVARPGDAYPVLLETVLRDALGRPAAGINVRYQGKGGGSWVGGNGWPPRTDDQGRVSVRWYAPTDGTVDYIVTAAVEGAVGFAPSSVQFSLRVSTQTISIGRDTTLTVGDSLRLQAMVEGLPVTSVTWQSSAPTVASVDASGKVLALSVGATQISATAQGLTATITLRVVAPLSSTAAARILSPVDFVGGRLTIDLPPTSSGQTLLFVVPGITSVDWSRGLPQATVSTTVRVDTLGPGQPTPGREIPLGKTLARAVWSSPRGAPPQAPPIRREFRVYSNTSGTYFPATGLLAYTGSRYIYYEDTTNTSNFTQAQYRVIDSTVTRYVPLLDSLMGPPTDLDGNGHIIVFLSKTVSVKRTAGEAYVDGCNINTAGSACGDIGEIVYFVAPDHFDDWSGSASFYVNDYYPRNILHESIHVLQYGHSYRRGGSFANWNAPAMAYEGLAELTRLDTRLGFLDTWSRLKQQFDARDFSKTPFADPYYRGAILNWWLLRRWGDGYPQAMIEAMYSAHASGQDLFQAAIGVDEPQLLAIFYASLFFDESEFGSRFGLQFPGETVPSLLGGSTMPTELLSPGVAVTRLLQYTEGRVFDVRHTQSIRITIDAGSFGAAVLIAQP